MNLFKRCPCPASARCAHPFWVRFRLHGQEYRRSTESANRVQAQRIATVRQAAVLEGREGLRKTKTIKLSEHIKGYLAFTAKTNPTAYKDKAVLDRLLAQVGDCRLGEVSPFHTCCACRKCSAFDLYRVGRMKDVGEVDDDGSTAQVRVRGRSEQHTRLSRGLSRW